MEKEAKFNSYNVITEEKEHHKLTAHEFLNNSCKLCPLISKNVKYRLQWFSPQMSNH